MHRIGRIHLQNPKPLSYIIYLLLQFGLGFGQRADFVFLNLQVIQCLLVGFLEGLFLLSEFRNVFIQSCHLFSEILNLQDRQHLYSEREKWQREHIVSAPLQNLAWMK